MLTDMLARSLLTQSQFHFSHTITIACFVFIIKERASPFSSLKIYRKNMPELETLTFNAIGSKCLSSNINNRRKGVSTNNC